MAEDEPELQQFEDEEDIIGRRIQKEHRENQRRRKCNSRIDQLATPNKRFILALWQEHAHHFEKERVENIKAKLQELYAMSPEETELYFSKLREEARKLAWRRLMRDKLKRLVARRRRIEDQKRAYRLFRRLLIDAMEYAYNHEPPLLVSSRLRMLSDIILEQLCDLRGIDVPDRRKTDKLGKFLIAVADWFAIGVEYIYFIVQMKKNEELEEIEESQIAEAKQKEKSKKKSDKTKRKPKPTTSSTPRQSVDKGSAK